MAPAGVAAVDGHYVGRMTKLIFGTFVTQGWKMELASNDGAAAKWANSVENAKLDEDHG